MAASTEAKRAYRLRNKAELNRKERERYRANREKRLAQTKEYRRTHRVQLAAAAKQWARKNPDRVREKAARFRDRNLETMRRLNLERYHKNKTPERLATLAQKAVERRRLWPEDRKAKAKVRTKDYYHRNKLKFFAAASKRRALEKSVAINPEQVEAWMIAVRRQPTAVCYYCQRRVPTSEVHFDHVLALSKGGAHSIENCAVSCAFCNLSKHAKLIHQWQKSGQQILSL